MGYYTTFTFSVNEIEEGKKEKDLIAEFRNSSEEAKYAFDEDGEPEDSTKWYSYHEDLIKFSKTSPGSIFLLEGNGEDSDQWKLYVKNGYHQECQAEVVFPEFDRAKLLGEIRKDKIDGVLNA